MSLDGAFSTAAALRRLLCRHPALRRADPRIAALEQKGEAMTANDLVAALADPFLHPSYTIPIVGCFRPLCQKIVERAVAKLGSIPSLELESDEIAEEVGDHDVYVIDFYAGKRRGLRLHELASFALCRALDLAPFLLRSTLSYFKFAPPPFQRLMLAGLPSPITEKAVKLLLEAARISYRFLVMDPKVFSELWDWSCFLDFVKKTADFHLYHGVLLSDVLDVRWCSIQILLVTLKTSDRSTECFGFGADETYQPRGLTLTERVLVDAIRQTLYSIRRLVHDRPSIDTMVETLTGMAIFLESVLEYIPTIPVAADIRGRDYGRASTSGHDHRVGSSGLRVSRSPSPDMPAAPEREPLRPLDLDLLPPTVSREHMRSVYSRRHRASSSQSRPTSTSATTDETQAIPEHPEGIMIVGLDEMASIEALDEVSIADLVVDDGRRRGRGRGRGRGRRGRGRSRG